MSDTPSRGHDPAPGWSHAQLQQHGDLSDRGSLASPTQHLVITASPRPLSNYAKAVDGPGWSPTAQVRPLAWITTSRWRMRAVFVSPDTNESAFTHHIAMVWTVGQHTYAVGFHNFTGTRATLRLDQQLAPWIELVGP